MQLNETPDILADAKGPNATSIGHSSEGPRGEGGIGTWTMIGFF